MLALSDSEDGVSHTLPVDPDQSRTATLFQKLEEAIKKETECIPKTAQISRAISRSINKELYTFEATGQKTASITKITAALESMPSTYVDADRAFSRDLELVLVIKILIVQVLYVHISCQSSLYFVLTAKSKLIIFLPMLFIKKAFYDYIVFLLCFSLHINALEAGFT